jgi:hypothetical protein
MKSSLIIPTITVYITSNKNRGIFRLGRILATVKSSIKEVSSILSVAKQFFLNYFINAFLTFYYRQ